MNSELLDIGSISKRTSKTTILAFGGRPEGIPPMNVAKKELRNKIKKILSDLPREAIAAQSSTAVRSLLSLPEYQSAKSLSVYLSMPSGEIITTDIIRDAFSKGKEVYVPYLSRLDSTTGKGSTSIMDMLALQSIEDFESLQPDKWGIPSLDASSVSSRRNCLGGYGVPNPESPPKDDEASGLDFIVMPGMAFDNSFARLGHGKGYYDNFLMRYDSIMSESGSARKPYLAALSLHDQLLSPPDKVPVAEHDYFLDALIVGDGEVLRRRP